MIDYVLTVPLVFAVLSAGMVGGIHCVGMCGGISTLLTQNRTTDQRVIPIIPFAQSHSIALWTHVGRLCTYSVIGALAGTVGAAGILFKPYVPVHDLMFVIGNVAIILLGLRLWGYVSGFSWVSKVFERLTERFVQNLRRISYFSLQVRIHPFLSGIIWGCVPCGLVYGVLPFSWLSGDPFSGAFLMFLFGLAALPYLLFVHSVTGWVKRGSVPFLLRKVVAILLLGIGVYGLWHVNHRVDLPSVFCVIGL